MKGSYTIEASVLIPLLLMVMALGMRMGIYLYQEIREQKEQQAVEELWEVKDFYQYQWIGAMTND